MAKQIPTGTRPVGGEQFHNLLANILNSTWHFARHIAACINTNGNDSNKNNKYIRDSTMLNFGDSQNLLWFKLIC